MSVGPKDKKPPNLRPHPFSASCGTLKKPLRHVMNFGDWDALSQASTSSWMP